MPRAQNSKISRTEFMRVLANLYPNGVKEVAKNRFTVSQLTPALLSLGHPRSGPLRTRRVSRNRVLDCYAEFEQKRHNGRSDAARLRALTTAVEKANIKIASSQHSGFMYLFDHSGDLYCVFAPSAISKVMECFDPESRKFDAKRNVIRNTLAQHLALGTASERKIAASLGFEGVGSESKFITSASPTSEVLLAELENCHSVRQKKRYLNSVLSLHEHSVRTLYQLLELEFEQGIYRKDLVKRILRAEKILPDDWHVYGVVLWRLHRRTEALEAFKKSADLDPTHFPSLLDLSIALTHAGEYQKAQKFARRAGDVAPHENALLRANLAEASALGRSGLRAEAIGKIEKGIANVAADNPLSTSLGYALLNAGDSNRASAKMSELITKDISKRERQIALMILAKIELSHGRVAKAIKFLHEGESAVPNDPVMLSGLSYCHLLRSEYPEAINCALAAVSVSKESPQALNALGSVYCKLGLLEDAHEVLKDCLDFVQTGGIAENARLNMANVFVLKSDPDRAVQVLKTAEEVSPKAIHIRLRMAEILFENDEFDFALKHLLYVLDNSTRPGFLVRALCCLLAICHERKESEAFEYNYDRLVKIYSDYRWTFPDSKMLLDVWRADGREIPLIEFVRFNIFDPESPASLVQWLIRQNRIEEAEIELESLRESGASETMIQFLRAKLEFAKGNMEIAFREASSLYLRCPLVGTYEQLVDRIAVQWVSQSLGPEVRSAFESMFHEAEDLPVSHFLMSGYYKRTGDSMLAKKFEGSGIRLLPNDTANKRLRMGI